MNLIAVSSKGWQAFPIPVKNILKILAEREEVTTTILDFHTVASYIKKEETCNANLIVYKFNINQSELQLLATNLLPDDILVIDASGVSLERLFKFLKSARKIWFHLDSWQPIFAIVFDDFKLVEIAEEMSSTFYSMPELISAYEVKDRTNKIKFNAKILKLFGPGSLIHFLHKINNIRKKFVILKA